MNRQETVDYKSIEESVGWMACHYVYDYMDKESLQEIIESDKISINEITLIFKQKLEELLK